MRTFAKHLRSVALTPDGRTSTTTFIIFPVNLGHRLHIDKALLREWRQDFARMMRDQGIAANATPRAVRGQNKRAATDATFRAQRRADSYAMRERVESIARELSTTGAVRDPARE